MSRAAVMQHGWRGGRVVCALAAVLTLAACAGDGAFPGLGPGSDRDAEAVLAEASSAMQERVGSAADSAVEAPAPERGAAADAVSEADDVEPAEDPEEIAAPEVQAPPPPPDRNAAARAACKRKGGFFTVIGGGKSGYCARYTKDGNRSCDTSSDCQGYCLARSRTCAPITPLIGCHQVLTDRGVASEICLN